MKPKIVNDFAILTNAKRALIALIHSLVFLGIATHSLFSTTVAGPITRRLGFAPVAVLLVYAIVTCILSWLVRSSSAAKEKLYFLFCATSAGTGLLRCILGDPAPHVAPAIRVLMLSCAVLTGLHILRDYSEIGVTLENRA